MSTRDITPVQILSKNHGNKLELHERALKEVLQNSWSMPTAIVAICGDKRKGKSFLINLLINYLKMNMEDKLMAKIGKTKVLEPTFEWRGGPARNTEGIWISNKPVVLNTKQGKIALYVMDTQGMFDNKTSKTECAQIFTLSTLMSSMLVFNLLRQLQSNDIEQLSFWTKSAQWVGNKGSSPVLQDLVLLIRDFPHKHLGYGVEGGMKYLDQQIDESDGNEEVNSNLGGLKEIFRNVSAFAMPGPGKKIEKRDDSIKPIKMKDIDQEFKHQSDVFFKQVKGGVLPLEVNNDQMTGETLYHYILKCAECILTGDMPMPKDLSDLVADHWLHDLVKKLVLDYQRRMEENLKNFGGDYDGLVKFHEKIKSAIIQLFQDSNKFGRETLVEDSLDLLVEEMNKEFEVLSWSNKEKKKAEEREAALLKCIDELRAKITQMEQMHRRDAQRADQKEQQMLKIMKALEEKEAKTKAEEATMKQQVEKLSKEIRTLHKRKRPQIQEKSSWSIPFLFSSSWDRTTTAD